MTRVSKQTASLMEARSRETPTEEQEEFEAEKLERVETWWVR
jgi:hypothetical protein|tara:strand:+ start:777 stop:902 length:126 start_codon:yes stop_codon:yes gene_type:complete